MSEGGAGPAGDEVAAAVRGDRSEQWALSEGGAGPAGDEVAAAVRGDRSERLGTVTAVTIDQRLPELPVHLDRAQLVRYAGASGDFNPIHWNARVATEVGLPDVIAHGMLTMALAGRLVTDWIGDPAAIVDYGVRFTRPVVVPDPDGVDVLLAGRVAEVDADAGTARVDITATVQGQTVLARARAVVRLPAAG